MTDLKKAKIIALREFVAKYNIDYWGANVHLNGITFCSPDKIECDIYGDMVRLMLYYDSEYMEVSIEDIYSLWCDLPSKGLLRFE